jgi:hypothetical protein
VDVAIDRLWQRIEIIGIIPAGKICPDIRTRGGTRGIEAGESDHVSRRPDGRTRQRQNRITEELMVSTLAMTDALAKLLIEKGVITDAEFKQKLLEERAVYQRILNPTTQ